MILQLTVVDTLVTKKSFAVLKNLFRVPGIAIVSFAACFTSLRVHNGLALLALFLLAGYVASTIGP